MNLGFPSATGGAVNKKLNDNTYGAFGTGIDQSNQMWDTGVGSLGQGDQYGQQAGAGYTTMAGANPRTLAETNLQPYMNQYTQGMIDPTMNELNRQEQLQKNVLDARATAAGSFGGDRSQIERAAMNRDFDITRKNAIAELYNKNFQNAQEGARFDITGAQQREAQGNQGLAGLGGNYMNQGSNFMDRANNASKDWANMGFGWGTDLNAQQLAAGGLQQQQQQALMDAIRKQFEGQANWPTQSLDILTGNNPSAAGQGTTKTTTTPSVGGIISGLLGF
jgi:hypothetical protein